MGLVFLPWDDSVHRDRDAASRAAVGREEPLASRRA